MKKGTVIFLLCIIFTIFSATLPAAATAYETETETAAETTTEAGEQPESKPIDDKIIYTVIALAAAGVIIGAYYIWTSKKAKK